MFRILCVVISVKDLARLQASASTAKPVPNARKLATRINRVQRHLNASIVEKIMLHTARNVLFIKRNMIYNQLECLVIFLFFEARTIYKKNSWTEGDELCWRHKGSNSELIGLYAD